MPETAAAAETISAAGEPKLTVVEQALRAIRERIRDGSYAPGQRLIEADLTGSLGISRGPLREAMWCLAGEGLVQIEANRGVTVRKLTREETRHRYQLREVLEGLAARLAAENIDAGSNREKFRKIFKAGEKLARANDIAGYIDSNEAFHDQIVTMSGNEMLSTLIGQLRVPLYRLQFKRLVTSPQAVLASAEEHAVVAEAILAGQGAQAERAMRRHIAESGRKLLALPDSTFD
jgi:DNA-binding GntR family transcriptional regulator